MSNQSILLSAPTNWLKIEQVPEGLESIDAISEQLNITFFSPVSDAVLQLHWNYTSPNYIKSPETFVVSYANISEKNYTHVVILY